jgi:hypothetical protein
MTTGTHPTHISKCVRFAGANFASLGGNPRTSLNWQTWEIGSSALAGLVIEALVMESSFTRCGWMKSPRERSTFPTRDSHRRKPVQADTYEQTRGDNEAPRNEFEKRNQFALVSWHFYYFGAKAIPIPRAFDVEKRGPGFRSRFDPANIGQFLDWLKKQSKQGKHVEPCYKVQPSCEELPKGNERCKSSC